MKACDIHCHFLPGLDDGPDELAETVAMLRAAWQSGSRALVATPHLYADFFPRSDIASIRRAFAAVASELERFADHSEDDFPHGLALHLGAEHYFDAAFLDALERDEVLPIGDGRYLLVEFPTRLPEQAVHAAAIRVLQAGYKPVLAHVERYDFVRDKPKRLRRFIDMGCVAQANVDGSEPFGGSSRFLRSLLRDGLVQVLASDGHGLERRPPALAPRAAPLVRAFSADAVTAWTWANPQRIIRGERL